MNLHVHIQCTCTYIVNQSIYMYMPRHVDRMGYIHVTMGMHVGLPGPGSCWTYTLRYVSHIHVFVFYIREPFAPCTDIYIICTWTFIYTHVVDYKVTQQPRHVHALSNVTVYTTEIVINPKSIGCGNHYNHMLWTFPLFFHCHCKSHRQEPVEAKASIQHAHCSGKRTIAYITSRYAL